MTSSLLPPAGRVTRRPACVQLLALLALCAALLAVPAPARAQDLTQTDIAGPAGSGYFGERVYVLPNGNYIVTDWLYDRAGVEDVGAVALYDGDTLQLISRLTGSSPGDHVSAGIVLPDGDYLAVSPGWDNPATGAIDAGAVTRIDATTGLSGTVSAANSLVGTTAGDRLGGLYGGAITILTNDSYVVASRGWDNGPVADAGAVTWCPADSPCTGPVTPTNSLVGTHAGDAVGGSETDEGGFGFVQALPDGNYLVLSPYWDNGAAVDAGAVTWGSGEGGVAGPVSAQNSLVGSQPYDRIGTNEVCTMQPNDRFVPNIHIWPDGAYLVLSPTWDDEGTAEAGAVTWAGPGGRVGPISPANSLVGAGAGHRLGATIYGSFTDPWVASAAAPAPASPDMPCPPRRSPITLLANGSYVVQSPASGSATWGSAKRPATGVISAANSLLGAGSARIVEVGTGNFVVDSGGSATWVDGTRGLTGTVSAANSLLGGSPGDGTGAFVTALSGGDYVVAMPGWDKGDVADAGLVVWVDGNAGRTGAVTAADGLSGSTAGDRVGAGLTPLTNGDYVVLSPAWHDAAGVSVGAATWQTEYELAAVVSAANSLVGSSAYDGHGLYAVPLFAGNYVVAAPRWNNGDLKDAGAVAWGTWAGGAAGVLSAENALVGGSAWDAIGGGSGGWNAPGGVQPLPNGSYLVRSPQWNNGAATDAGAVTWGDRDGGVRGVVSPANSLVGGHRDDRVGTGVTILPNGNYVVVSPRWDSGTITDTGAVTWGDGAAGIRGRVSAANSLVGSHAGAEVGNTDTIVLLNDGNFVVRTAGGTINDVARIGAVTWVDANRGITGAVSAANSLLGREPGYIDLWKDFYASLEAGSYAVLTDSWYPAVPAGQAVASVTWSHAPGGLCGYAPGPDSVLAQGSVGSLWVTYDAQRDRLLVGQPESNRVTVVEVKPWLYRMRLPLVER